MHGNLQLVSVVVVVAVHVLVVVFVVHVVVVVVAFVRVAVVHTVGPLSSDVRSPSSPSVEPTPLSDVVINYNNCNDNPLGGFHRR